jgi:lycopene cyclase domain-containing protein
VTYTVAATLGVLGALVVDVVLLRTRLVTRLAFWATYPIIFGFQLLSNGVLTGLGVVRYDPAAILGPRIAYAPVEDLAFGFALVLTTLSVWVRLGRAEARHGRLGQPAGGGRGELGQHLDTLGIEGHGAQRGKGRPGQVGDALLGAGEGPGRGDDLA